MEISRDYKTDDDNNLLSKIVVIGDANVGKTNIIRRIIGEDFREMEATIGVEFMYINIKDIDKDDPNKTMSIQIWDTSGAERYKAITTTHIRGADGAYIVYDISNESSFTHLNYWYNCLKDAADKDIIIFLIGNKSDLIYEEGRAVKKKDAIDFVNKNNLQGYAECSAKNNENIKETFEKFYKILYNKNKNKIKEKKMKLELIDKKKNDNKKDFCCQ
jgi:Ras-related protein Rab-11A